jgi:hypothetical protein
MQLPKIRYNQKNFYNRAEEIAKKALNNDDNFPDAHALSMIALIEPPMIAVMEPFVSGQKAISDGLKN